MQGTQPRALLIQPPVYDFAFFDLFSKPFALERIAAALYKGGYYIDFVNALDYSDPASIHALKAPKRNSNGTGKIFRTPLTTPPALKEHIQTPQSRRFARYGVLPETFEHQIGRSRPDIIFISSGMTYWYPGVIEAAETAARLHPGIPMICGGIYASLLPEHCSRNTGAEVCGGPLSTEGLNRLLSAHHLPGVPGSGSLPSGSEHPLTTDKAGVLRLNEGCPCSCDYCASSRLSPAPGFIPGSYQEAFRSFAALHRRGVRHFAFYDDALLMHKTEVLEPFLSEVIESGLTASFYTPNAVHLNQIDLPGAMLMKKAGFREIRLGYESSSDMFHDSHGRKYETRCFRESVGILKEAGFRRNETAVYILAGLPEQDYREVLDSIEECRKAGVKIYIAEFSPVPGSPLWGRCIQQSRLPLDEEPLLQNNTFFAMEWSGFSHENLRNIKETAKAWNRSLAAR